MYAVKFLVWRNKALNGVETYEPQGNKRFVIRPNGQPEPVTFEHYRSDELHLKVSYPSGIIGTVVAEERISFVHKRK